MHIVYLNNQQYIAQSVHATTIFLLLCVYILSRHILKSLRNKSFSWQGLLGRVIFSVYATLVATFTLSFYKWSSFATYLSVIKGYGGFGQYTFAHLSFFNADNVAFSWYQLTGNFMLLLPLGFLAPFLFPKWRGLLHIVPRIFLTTLTIEIIQGTSTFFYLSNRIFDMNDLAVNTIGGIVGYIIYRMTIFVMKKNDNFVSNYVEKGDLHEHNLYIKS
ncbi:VanZ family protein [Leuconostoc mesenteroides]